MIEPDNHSSTEQGSFSDGDISAIKELASITENAMEVITELNVPIIRGKIIGRPWNSLISIAPKDSLELKPFISEGSIAVTEVEFIKKDDVEDITDENGDCDLLGSLKSVTVFIRQGTTSTWFGIEFKTKAGVELERRIEEYETLGYVDEVGEDNSANIDAIVKEQYRLSAIAATRDEFAFLRNKRERRAFVGNVLTELGWADFQDWQIERLAETTKSIYELGVLPRKCRALLDAGLSPAQIAKEIGKSKGTVEKALTIQTPDFVEEALALVEDETANELSQNENS